MRSIQKIVPNLSLGLYGLFLVFAIPLTTYADSNSVGSIRDLIDRMLVIVNPLIALLFGFAVLAFVRGIAVFIWQADNEEKRAEGKKFIIWGIVGLFVMIGFWGMVFIIQEFYFGDGPIGSPFKP